MSQPDEVVRAEFAKFAVSEACPMRFHAPDVDSWLDGNDRMGVIEDRYRWWKAGRASLLARVEAAEGALAKIASHPNALFNVAAVGHGTPTIREIARLALRASGTREGA